MKTNEVIKHARELARNANLTFKVDNSCRANGATDYKIVSRETGIVHKNWKAMNLSSAYETLCGM